MKKMLLAASVVLTVASLVACDDETTNVTETTGMTLVEKGANMPECTTDNAGEMVYSTDSAAAFFCADGKWQSLKGEKGEKGIQGEQGPKGESIEGKQGPQGPKGDDGDKGDDGVGTPGAAGASCTVKALDGNKGYKIECGGDSVGVVLNGNDGVGTAGDPGESCTAQVLDNNKGYKIVCGGDSVGVVFNGNDGVGCSLEDNGYGSVTITCGEDTPVTLYKAMCVDMPYEPVNQFCVAGSVYNKCGHSTYDPALYYCSEDGELKALPSCSGQSFNPTTQLCDTRDYHVYKIVTIDIPSKNYSGTWMAENINYITAEGSYCYDDQSSSCAKYGRLYSWATAMGKTEAQCGSGHRCGYDVKDTVQGICPDGWHLPSYVEWSALVAATNYTDLRSKTWGGTDAYNFSVLPAGRIIPSGWSLDEEADAFFWTSTEEGLNEADHIAFVDNDVPEYINKGNHYSVRCIKDAE